VDKRTLSKIPIKEEGPLLKNLFEGTDGIRYVATVESHESILLFNIYERTCVETGLSQPKFRIFFSDNDDISQEISVGKIKWRSSCLERLLDYDKAMFYTENDFTLVSSFFQDYWVPWGKTIWSAINNFQNQVRARYLEVKHKKEKDLIDRKMKEIKKVPKNFKDWIDKTGLKKSTYVYYEPLRGRRYTEGYCTYCKKTFMIDTRKEKPKHREKCICPCCKNTAIYLSGGRLENSFKDDVWVSYIKKTQNGFVMRYYLASKIHNPKERSYEVQYRELARAFFEQDAITCFEWANFKQTGEIRWCNGRGIFKYDHSVLYTGNLPEALDNSGYKYCAIDILAKKYIGEEMNYHVFLKTYLKEPFIEQFIKLDLLTLYFQHVTNYYDSNPMNAQGTRIQDILKLSKPFVKLLIQHDGGLKMLRVMQAFCKHGLPPDMERIQWFMDKYDSKVEIIDYTLYATLHKIEKYIDKETDKVFLKKEKAYYLQNQTDEEVKVFYRKNITNDWLDYLKWCRALKYDLKNKSILFPVNLKKVHDRTYKEYQVLKEKEAKAERKREEKRINALLAELKDVPALSIEYRALVVVSPKNYNDLLQEGHKLNHCIADYAKGMVENKYMIYFIRKKDEIDKPYYTMQYMKGKVTQCRGKGNRMMNDDVATFTKLFERKMNQHEFELHAGKAAA